ncbi:hypothetical protein GUITHDRAFT_103563 [Guillardia theta CCMP2712]|uniref:Uncharacterized protein n=1 Tax=Guillardia theta (strain CCMP2712) TaxID=905079 RepID=L1JRQ3_GUITC|nr:hypothetical protein GUITHDRAFT_103563 [Guillardia theta CCMP2712]EKX50979.1 hypothetical protein GUITHDRAFT_103563 [Guillardia theta CCMP2712]|eukprot:XP_005837959.1 hypothetical protein GUITHDRAFT_103563 [Guillardia theta CCMP2712]
MQNYDARQELQPAVVIEQPRAISPLKVDDTLATTTPTPVGFSEDNEVFETWLRKEYRGTVDFTILRPFEFKKGKGGKYVMAES